MKEYLLSFGIERLEQTGKTHMINNKKIKARKKTNNKWFETQDSISYWDDFSKQKIIWSDIATEPNFILEDSEIYFNNTCYMITGAPNWLASYLNSDLIAWYFPRAIATDLGSGSRYFKQFVERIPVPKNIDTRNIYRLFELTDAEIKFISSSVKR